MSIFTSGTACLIHLDHASPYSGRCLATSEQELQLSLLFVVAVVFVVYFHGIRIRGAFLTHSYVVQSSWHQWCLFDKMFKKVQVIQPRVPTNLIPSTHTQTHTHTHTQTHTHTHTHLNGQPKFN